MHTGIHKLGKKRQKKASAGQRTIILVEYTRHTSWHHTIPVLSQVPASDTGKEMIKIFFGLEVTVRGTTSKFPELVYKMGLIIVPKTKHHIL